MSNAGAERWTGKMLSDRRAIQSDNFTAEEINASLDAERERTKFAQDHIDIYVNDNKQLRDQLQAKEQELKRAGESVANLAKYTAELSGIKRDLSAYREALQMARKWLPNSRCPAPNEERAYEIIDALLAQEEK